MAFDVGSIIAHLKLDSSNFQQSLTGASRQAEEGGLSMGKLAGGVALGQAAFAAAQAVISGVTERLKDTVGSAESFGKTVLQLRRDTGLTAEAASGLAFAFQHLGIDADTGAALLVKFDKQIAAAADPIGKHAAALTALGVNVRDAGGGMRSMTDILGDTADKINALGSQEEKVAEVTKLFGRAGEPMLKFLALGKDGMAELEGEAKKYGLTLTTDNLDAVQKSIRAHRDFDAAMEGINLKIGMALLPMFTAFTNKLTEFSQNKSVQEWAAKLAEALIKVGHAIEAVAKWVGSVVVWFEKHKAATQALEGALAGLAVVLGVLLIIGAVTAAFAAFAAVMAFVASPIGIIIIVAMALGAVAMLVINNWGAVSRFFGSIWEDIKGFFAAGVNFIRANWELIFAILTGPFGLAIWWIRNNWAAIINFVHDVVGGIGNAIGAVEGILIRPFQNAYNAIAGVINGIKNTVSGVGNALHNAHIPGFATGITNFAGGMALVGERGPELIQLPQGASVIPNNQIGMAGNGGVSLQVHGDLNIASDYDVDSFMKRLQRNVELQRQGGSAI